MKRTRTTTTSYPRKRNRYSNVYRRPSRKQYENLVIARPMRMAPVATRGYRFPNKGEKKTIDVTHTNNAVSTTPYIQLMNGCIQGTDYTQRIGRKIYMNSFYLRGSIRNYDASGPIANTTPCVLARVMVVCDMQPNGTVFAATDLLNTATSYSQLNLNNRDRFKVLMDKQYTFDPYLFSATASSSFASTVNQIWPMKKYKKINMESVFNAGNAGTIADINSNAIYLFIITDVVAGTANVQIEATTRIRFQDP